MNKSVFFVYLLPPTKEIVNKKHFLHFLSSYNVKKWTNVL